MVKLHFAIAITRTCGSGGGSYIGKKLAELYGIDLYDPQTAAAGLGGQRHQRGDLRQGRRETPARRCSTR